MKKVIRFFLLSFALLCTSCDGIKILVSDSTSGMPSESVSDHSSGNDNISDEKTYEKDEEGFYILEDDYFTVNSIADDKEVTHLRFASSYPDEYVYKQMRLMAGNEQIPLFNCKTNFSQTWNAEAPERMNNSVAVVELKGKMEFKLQCNFAILQNCVIRPLAANIIPSIDENRRVVTFVISSPGQYTIEMKGNRTLHLFVNEYQEFETYKNDGRVIYFSQGVHNKNNSSYINDQNLIEVASNTTIYLEMGAIVQAGFIANYQSNIKIVGGGILDGSVFPRSASTNEKLIPFEFNYCTDLLFGGIVATDPAGWCYNLYFCNRVTLQNIKIISSRSNGDGVSVQSCQNLTCKDSFVRSWDDSLVVKNYPKWSNRNEQGTTKNILFENCIVWTDLAQSMEVGYETVGEVMEDITFNNITVLHNFHKAVISIHNANNAAIKNVTFSNITIEDAAMGRGDGNPYLIDLSVAFSETWSTNHAITSLGSIDGVIIQNVLVLECILQPAIRVCGSYDVRDGYQSAHYINHVSFIDLQIAGVLIDKEKINYEENYATDITFLSTGNEVDGSSVIYDDASSYGTAFEIEKI